MIIITTITITITDTTQAGTPVLEECLPDTLSARWLADNSVVVALDLLRSGTKAHTEPAPHLTALPEAMAAVQDHTAAAALALTAAPEASPVANKRINHYQ